MIKIYIGSKYHAKSRLKRVRDCLNTYPHLQVLSSWMDNKESIINIEDMAPEYNAEEAARDYRELIASDIFIVDTIDESNTGGREVEIGIALASQIPVWRVGPRRNVFHYILQREFADWTQVIDELVDTDMILKKGS